MIHFSNVGLSIILSQVTAEEKRSGVLAGDQCANYLVNFIMDTILGVFLVWILLGLVSKMAYRFDVRELKEQGFYDDPPSCCFYFSQLCIFLVVTLFSKFLLGILFIWFESDLGVVGRIICQPFKDDPDAELTFVMVVCPSILNIVQVLFNI
jgi:uncharacterized membrane protein YjgN (DUF898 family)